MELSILKISKPMDFMNRILWSLKKSLDLTRKSMEGLFESKMSFPHTAFSLRISTSMGLMNETDTLRR